ncbi:MAG: cyclic nucleotide-binding domain-containing protein [Alphaproteobacteria bacterium]|nr:cyclic nucleotide-binding domain-containing protein [Alphaproteobacteria bacterium]
MSISASGDQRSRLERALARAPLFGSLDHATRATLERAFTFRALQGGAALFRPGAASDAIYLVAAGCLGVFRHDSPQDEPQLIAEVPPGDIVGEMSMLAGTPRTRAVAALRDSEVWRLAREDFDELARAHPEGLATLTRKVAVRTASIPPYKRRQPRTFALLPMGHDVPAARFAVSLSAALERRGGDTQMLGPESAERGPEWFSRCEAESAHVVYRADPGDTDWTRLCLRQADCLIVLRRADDPRPTSLPFPLETEAAGEVFQRRRELVLLHDARDAAPGSTAALLADGAFGPHHHVRLDTAGDIDRLARLLTGTAVGVVMAGGGARGFAHIGAVKALRAAGVPIDLAGGTSMGAIVAAAAAARWTDAEMDERFRRSFVATNPLSDYTVPLVSLFGGRRVTRLLQATFGDLRIEDLPLAFFCVTANLTDSRSDLHDRGEVWRWLRASVSIPGVLAPHTEAGSVHVDGGVIDNFPVRAMRKLGRGLTIGIDIDTGGAMAAGADVQEPWSAWQFFRRLVWKRRETLPIPSIVRILLRSALVSSTARALEDRQAADLLVLPPVGGFDLLDWTSFDAVVEAGYRATMEALERNRDSPAAAILGVR